MTPILLLCQVLDSPLECDKWRSDIERYMMRHFRISTMGLTYREEQKNLAQHVRETLQCKDKQSIATAPTDGTEIIVYDAEGDRNIVSWGYIVDVIEEKYRTDFEQGWCIKGTSNNDYSASSTVENPVWWHY